MNAVLIVVAGHVYHMPGWLIPAAIASPGSMFSVRLGKKILITWRWRR